MSDEGSGLFRSELRFCRLPFHCVQIDMELAKPDAVGDVGACQHQVDTFTGLERDLRRRKGVALRSHLDPAWARRRLRPCRKQWKERDCKQRKFKYSPRDDYLRVLPYSFGLVLMPVGYLNIEHCNSK